MDLNFINLLKQLQFKTREAKNLYLNADPFNQKRPLLVFKEN